MDISGAPKPSRIRGKDFGLGSYKFNRWSAELDESQTLEDALDPSFWADIVPIIVGHDKSRGRGDIIEVRKIEEGLYAELLVVAVGVGFARVVLLREGRAPVKEVDERSPLATRWNPGKKVHEVIRSADKALMASGFQTKADAVLWIEDHLRQMAA